MTFCRFWAGKGRLPQPADSLVQTLCKVYGLGSTERFLFNNGTKDALFSGTPKSLRPGAITIGAAERVAQMATQAKVAGAPLNAHSGILGVTHGVDSRHDVVVKCVKKVYKLHIQSVFSVHKREV